MAAPQNPSQTICLRVFTAAAERECEECEGRRNGAMLISCDIPDMFPKIATANSMAMICNRVSACKPRIPIHTHY